MVSKAQELGYELVKVPFFADKDSKGELKTTIPEWDR